MLDYYERSLILHEHLRGKIGTVGKMPIVDKDDLSLAYTLSLIHISEPTRPY